MSLHSELRRFHAFASVVKKYFPPAFIRQMKTPTPDFTNRRYLDAIDDDIVIFDGAMGTSIRGYDLTSTDFGGTLPNEDSYFRLVLA